uniref:Uncharacterized protein n=1 Tax=Anguilla anguilla TaxID=7936 RepID=A0A0E9XNR1_ANGAN
MILVPADQNSVFSQVVVCRFFGHAPFVLLLSQYIF